MVEVLHAGATRWRSCKTVSRLRLVDLSSDTSTRPSTEMLTIMTASPLGDERKHGDTTTNAVPKSVADHLGGGSGVRG
jgi:hypothetical protein